MMMVVMMTTGKWAMMVKWEKRGKFRPLELNIFSSEILTRRINPPLRTVYHIRTEPRAKRTSGVEFFPIESEIRPKKNILFSPVLRFSPLIDFHIWCLFFPLPGDCQFNLTNDFGWRGTCNFITFLPISLSTHYLPSQGRKWWWRRRMKQEENLIGASLRSTTDLLTGHKIRREKRASQSFVRWHTNWLLRDYL